jgi:integrase
MPTKRKDRTVALDHLTVKSLEAAPGEAQTEYWDADTPGLSLRVGKGGTKTWYLRYRFRGRNRRLKLGRFGEGGKGMGLSEARKEAWRKRVQAEGGEDPAQERADRRAGDLSFRALARDCLDHRARKTRPATRKERERKFKAVLEPLWGDRDATEITRRDVYDLHERLVRAGKPVHANRVVALVKLVFNHGLKTGWPGLEGNPAALIEPEPEKGRDRLLGREEMKAIWAATEPENPLTQGIFRLVALTVSRVGAVRAMKWRDVDLDGGTWTIPEDDFKGKRDFAVPLSPEARAILRELHELTGAGEYVFPGRADGKRPHITSTNKALQRIRKRSRVEDWNLHDWRTAFRTWALRPREPEPGEPAGLGLTEPVADLILGHKPSGVGYDHYQADRARYLLAERRAGLNAWAEFLREAIKDD